MKLDRFLSNYLRATAVPKPIEVTIERVVVEKVGIGEEASEKLVVYFEEVDQGLVASKTVLQQLAALLESEETDEWIGRRVTLFNDRTVTFKGKTVGGLRVRPAKEAE